MLTTRTIFYRKMFRKAMRSFRFWRAQGAETRHYKDEARAMLIAYRDAKLHNL